MSGFYGPCSTVIHAYSPNNAASNHPTALPWDGYCGVRMQHFLRQHPLAWPLAKTDAGLYFFAALSALITFAA